MIHQQVHSLSQEKTVAALETPVIYRIGKFALLTSFILVDFGVLMMAITWFATSALELPMDSVGFTLSLPVVVGSVFVALLMTASMPLVCRIFSAEPDY